MSNSHRAKGGFRQHGKTPGVRGSNSGQNPACQGDQMTSTIPYSPVNSGGGVASVAATAREVHPTEGQVEVGARWGS